MYFYSIIDLDRSVWLSHVKKGVIDAWVYTLCHIIYCLHTGTFFYTAEHTIELPHTACHVIWWNATTVFSAQKWPCTQMTFISTLIIQACRDNLPQLCWLCSVLFCTTWWPHTVITSRSPLCAWRTFRRIHIYHSSSAALGGHQPDISNSSNHFLWLLSNIHMLLMFRNNLASKWEHLANSTQKCN